MPPTRKWLFDDPNDALISLAQQVNRLYLADEQLCLRELVEAARLGNEQTARVLEDARRLAGRMRDSADQRGGLDAFLGEYSLSSREGVVLMCLAESLLRIPDADTADRLIADKLGSADFHEHLGGSESVLVNMATWGLTLTGRILEREAPGDFSIRRIVGELVTRLGEPVVRAALRQAMGLMGRHFIIAETIDAAIERASEPANRMYRYSFDMLGEAAVTTPDAERFLDAYAGAIRRLATSGHEGEPYGISVKLSALCPRFEIAQAQRAERELHGRMTEVAELARDASIPVTIDAEEAHRLELTLRVFETLLHEPSLSGWDGLGIAVQAYQKRAPDVIDWLDRTAKSSGKTIPVRLVKGAYWDTEIKWAQLRGLESFPVFTRKSSTDVSYLACARRLLAASQRLYPQFATHNVHTVVWLQHVGHGRQFEFQRLHGMGEELYREVVQTDRDAHPCRVYAPVGAHRELLPYLVRRLLENGANTSFVNRFVDRDVPVEELVTDPVAVSRGHRVGNPRIALPNQLFGAERRNSEGINEHDPCALAALAASLTAARRSMEIRPGTPPFEAAPIHAVDPAGVAGRIGTFHAADSAAATAALDAAHAGFAEWRDTPAGHRAQVLRRCSDLLEIKRAELVRLCVEETGRTVPDALAEVREAVDYLRYYASECERLFGADTLLPSPVGEDNRLRLGGRGVFMCISPWNFPIAIFTGQIAAALAAGNAVIAKPAAPATLTGAKIAELFGHGGVPDSALQFLPGNGATLGAALFPDSRLSGVAFTGSTATAQAINRSLAARAGTIAVLIAETGGVNAMLVDSSALAEQVVRDVLRSAFNSAGQRCSALRLLCVPHDTAGALIEMLTGAMRELVIGDPALLSTDVGPVIDADARDRLLSYCEANADRIIYQCTLPSNLTTGWYVPPALIELHSAADLAEEVFGPILHVVRYDTDRLDELVHQLNRVGYGLTLGIHSRIESLARHVADEARVGNVYVNRDMIGAVVGVQPFGGMGASGTGPKAGGPNYVSRFAVEQTISTNTAAVGGDAVLLASADD